MTVKNLQAFVTSTAVTGVTRKTLENILQTVFSILRTARKFGNSLHQVKRSELMLPRNEALEVVRFLSAKEVGQIINNAKEPYATMFAVLGMTGCRVGEMLGLKIGDLDCNRKVIYIRRSIDSRTKQEQSTETKNSTGEVPMPAALEKRLRAFLNTGYRENENRYLFANQNGNAFSVGKVTEYLQSILWQKKSRAKQLTWSQVLNWSQSQVKCFIFSKSGAGDGNRTMSEACESTPKRAMRVEARMRPKPSWRKAAKASNCR